MDLNINLASNKELGEKWDAFISAFKERACFPAKEANDYLTSLGVRIGYAIGGIGHANAPFIYAILKGYLGELEKDYPGVEEIAADLYGMGQAITVKMPVSEGDQ